jgi:hypothetical protein
MRTTVPPLAFAFLSLMLAHAGVGYDTAARGNSGAAPSREEILAFANATGAPEPARAGQPSPGQLATSIVYAALLASAKPGLFYVPPAVMALCAGPGGGEVCTAVVRQAFDRCKAGCDFNTFMQTLRTACGAIPVNDPAAAPAAGECARAEDSILQYLDEAPPEFRVRDIASGTGAIIRPLGPDHVEVVTLTGDTPDRFLVQHAHLLEGVFLRLDRNTFTLTEGGQTYRVHRAPENTRIEGDEVTFLVDHPDGFTFPVVRGDWAAPRQSVLGPNDIHTDSGVLRPLPDGRYRVVAGNRAAPIATNPPAVKEVFSHVPEGTDTVTVIEGGRGFTLTRPPQTPGAAPRPSLEASTAALLLDDKPLEVRVDDPVRGFVGARLRVLGPGRFAITSRANLETPTHEALLEELFRRLPGAESITLLDRRDEYVVTAAPPETTVGGRPVKFFIRGPDGRTVPAWVGSPAPPRPPPPAARPARRSIHGISLEHRPDLIVSSLAEIGRRLESAPLAAEDGGIAAVAVSNGISTGPDAFDVHMLNFGKPAYVRGEGAVLEPVTGAEADRLRALLNRLPPNRTTRVSAPAYCLEKNARTPAKGEIYVLAAGDRQRTFDPARRILSASDRVRGRLRPDSDPDAYFHSIRQWAIWSHEQGYDEARFTEAFVRHARENVEAAGRQWTPAIEALVRERSPQRFADIRLMLAAAGLTDQPANL